jgi:hypothetical protein
MLPEWWFANGMIASKKSQYLNLSATISVPQSQRLNLDAKPIQELKQSVWGDADPMEGRAHMAWRRPKGGGSVLAAAPGNPLVDQLLQANQLVAGLLVGLLGIGAAQAAQLGVEGQQHGMVLVQSAISGPDPTSLSLS